MAEINLSSQQLIDGSVPVNWPHPGKAAFVLILTVIAIILFGLLMLYSTSSGIEGATLFIKQAIWALLGAASAFIVYFIGYRRIIKMSTLLIAVSIVLLAIAFFSKSVKGANRWIHLPMGLSVQPSEFAKLALIIFLAHFCSVKQRFLNSYQGILSATGISVAVCAMILIGKDLGTTILLAATAWIMFFVAGVKLKYLLLSLSLIPFGSIYLKFMDPERWSRISSFLHPESFLKGSGYQLWNSLLALGSGSWFGLGFTESRMKAMYLPEAHTDFILSIVGEELGYIVMLTVILAYSVFMIFSVYISICSKDRYGMLLGFGISSLISMQALINIAVISGSLPTKGIPAPFISYGGSNMLMCMICVGLITSIAKSNLPAASGSNSFSFSKTKSLSP